MKKVTGIGGIFFKSKNTEEMKNWYAKHLGIPNEQYGANFEWRKHDKPEEKGLTVWSLFKEDTKYFDPSKKEFMINYIVEDLEGLVQELKKEGVRIVDEIQTYDYGKFVHILDPEENIIELWEPMEAGSQEIT